MASPLLHAAAGTWVARAAGAPTWALAAAACLPDADLLPGLITGDFARYHHGPSHSLVAAMAAAVALPTAGFGGAPKRRAAAAVGIAYLSHLVLDLLSYDGFTADGVGLPLLWPASDARLLAPVHLLFFGIAPDATGLLHGVLRWSNLWALVWEGGLVLLVASLAAAARPRSPAGGRRSRRRALVGGVVAAAILLGSLPHLRGGVLEALPAGKPGSRPEAADAGAVAPPEAGSVSREPERPEEAPAPDEAPTEPLPAADGRPAFSEAHLSENAREWIVEHGALIRDVAERLGVSPVSLAGVVAAERTLLRDPFDASVDVLFRAYFATLTESELRAWVSHQESAYQRGLRSRGDPGLRPLKNPYLWSVGPAQVSFRNAIFYEPRLARLQARPKRSLRELVQALLEARGSLEYAAVILLDAQEAYARYADLDVRGEPGVLATLYHLGSPAHRAIRLGEENRRRELSGHSPAPPRMNFYGEFVDRHAAELDELIR